MLCSIHSQCFRRGRNVHATSIHGLWHKRTCLPRSWHTRLWRTPHDISHESPKLWHSRFHHTRNPRIARTHIVRTVKHVFLITVRYKPLNLNWKPSFAYRNVRITSYLNWDSNNNASDAQQFLQETNSIYYFPILEKTDVANDLWMYCPYILILFSIFAQNLET